MGFLVESGDVGIFGAARYGFSIVFGCRHETQLAYCYVLSRLLLQIDEELWAN